MNKFLIIFFGTQIQTTITFIILSFLINIKLIPAIRKNDGLKNILLGLHLTLIGMLLYYEVSNYVFTTVFWSIAMYFLPIYIITLGFSISLNGYKSDNKK